MTIFSSHTKIQLEEQDSSLNFLFGDGNGSPLGRARSADYFGSASLEFCICVCALLTLRRPPPEPCKHAACIYFDFTLLPDDLTIAPRLSAMSVISPNGSTSICALSSRPRVIICTAARLRTGVRALTMWPWRERLDLVGTAAIDPPSLEHGARDSDSEDSDSDDDDDDAISGVPATVKVIAPSPLLPRQRASRSAVGALQRARSAPAGGDESSLVRLSVDLHPPLTSRSTFLVIACNCRHCGSSWLLAPEDPYHAFFECTAGEFPVLRVRLWVAAKSEWLNLLNRLVQCLRKAYPVNNDEEAFSLAKAAVDTLDPANPSAEFRFID